MAKITRFKQHGDWEYYRWADGVVQWRFEPYAQECADSDEPAAYIERVLKPVPSRKVRSKWHIVERAGMSNGVYPKKIAGPFPSFKAVRSAFRLITQGD